MNGLGSFKGPLVDVTAVKTYLTNSIFPTLVPGLVQLMKKLEETKTVGQADHHELFDTQSVGLRQYVSTELAPVLNDALEELYNEKPDDPVDCLAKKMFLYEESTARSSKKSQMPINPVHWLGQFLMRNNPAHNVPSEKHILMNQRPTPSSTSTNLVPKPPPRAKSSGRGFKGKGRGMIDRSASISSQRKNSEATSTTLVQQEHITNGMHLLVTVLQDGARGGLTFQAYNAHRSVQYNTEMSKSDLAALVPELEEGQVSEAGAAQMVIARLRLERGAQTRLVVAKESAGKDLERGPLYQGLHTIEDCPYVVEVTLPNPAQSMIQIRVYDQRSEKTGTATHDLASARLQWDSAECGLMLKKLCNKQLRVTEAQPESGDGDVADGDSESGGGLVLTVGASPKKKKKQQQELADAQELAESLAQLRCAAADGDATRVRDVRCMESRMALWAQRTDMFFGRRKVVKERTLAVVYKEVMRMEKRMVIMMMQISVVGLNGTILWTAYDQTTCETFTLTLKNRDTRHLQPPGPPGSLLGGDAKAAAAQIAARLRVVEKRGELRLQLEEESPIVTKWREAFDKFATDSNGCVDRQDLIDVLRGTGAEVTSFIRTLSEETCAQHAARYLHAMLERVQSEEDKQAFSWDDFSDCMATPTPHELVPTPLADKSAKLVLKHKKENNVTGGRLDVFIYAQPDRCRAPTLIQAWDLATFQDYTLQTSIPYTQLLKEKTFGSEEQIAAEMVSRLRLVKELVARPVCGQAGIHEQPVYRGAKYIDGKNTMASVYSDSRIRIYVPSESKWYEASLLDGEKPDLENCWEMIKFKRSPTGLTLVFSHEGEKYSKRKTPIRLA